jgi:hypothetical protein
MPHSKEVLEEHRENLAIAMSTLMERAQAETKQDLTRRGSFAAMTRWINQKLSEFNESPVSDQSVANWVRGKLGSQGLDDRSARKLGLLMGYARDEAGPAFKLCLQNGFSFVGGHPGTCPCLPPLSLLLRWIEYAPDEWVPSIQSAARDRDRTKQQEQEMCLLGAIHAVFDEEDDFVRAIPSTSPTERIRYREIFRAHDQVRLTRGETMLITAVIEDHAGISVEDLDPCRI